MFTCIIKHYALFTRVKKASFLSLPESVPARRRTAGGQAVMAQEGGKESRGVTGAANSSAVHKHTQHR